LNAFIQEFGHALDAARIELLGTAGVTEEELGSVQEREVGTPAEDVARLEIQGILGKLDDLEQAQFDEIEAALERLRGGLRCGRDMPGRHSGWQASRRAGRSAMSHLPGAAGGPSCAHQLLHVQRWNEVSGQDPFSRRTLFKTGLVKNALTPVLRASAFALSESSVLIRITGMDGTRART
jgi:hypothetical protein